MENAVIGLFDNYGHARSAADALLAAGFPEWTVQITPKQQTWAARHAAMDESARHASPGGWSIGEFFRSLFGTDADHEHVHIYTEALRRGSFLVTVETEDEQQARQAGDLIAQFHPIDIEERAAHWRSQGWTRALPQQAPYTDEQVRAEREQYMGLAGGSQAGSRAPGNAAVRSYQRSGTASAASSMAADRSVRMSQSDTAAAGGDSLLGGGDSLIGEPDK